jgi:hypothetical protein
MSGELILKKQKEIEVFLEVECSPEPFKFSKQTTSLIEDGWNKVISRRDNLVSLPLLRVKEKINVENHVLVKVVDDVYYKDVVGLRNYPNFLEKVVADELFSVLSYMSIVSTCDGHKVLLERNSGDWEHSLEFPGGFVRTSDAGNDLCTIAMNGLKKDLNISDGNISKFEFVKFFDYQAICETLVLFSAKLDLIFEELQSKSNGNIFKLPDGYLAEAHNDFFDLPFHIPSREIHSLVSKDPAIDLF